MVLVTLGVVFLIVYIFTSDEKQSIYLPFLLNFVMMLYYPVTGIDLVIRLSILGGSALLIMLLQMLLNRNKFRKKIVKKINESIELMNQQVNAIAVGEDIDKIKERGGVIFKYLSLIHILPLRYSRSPPRHRLEPRPSAFSAYHADIVLLQLLWDRF